MPKSKFIPSLLPAVPTWQRWFGLLSIAAAVGIFCWNHAGAQNDENADEPFAARPENNNAQQADEAPEQESKPPKARVIRVPLPISGNVDRQVKSQITRVLDELELPQEPRPVLLLEFSTGQTEFGLGSDYTRALSLARFLASPELSGVKTVAYLPGPIRGHAVLVAMACEEIVMAPDAEIGDAGADEPADAPIDVTVRSGYSQIASRRRTIPPEIALGMLDKDLEVLRAETEVSTEYVLKEDLEELKQTKTLQGEPETIIARGERGRFTGREARDFGIARYLAEDRQAVARAMGLPVEALNDITLVDGDWRPKTFLLNQSIDHKLITTRQRFIQDSIRDDGANFILIWLDSEGGEPESAIQFATFLADLNEEEVLTVAYIENEASGVASVIASACDQIVMRPSAIIGGRGVGELKDAEILELQSVLKDDIAVKQAGDWSIAAAMINPDLEVFQYTHQKTGAVAYFSPEEAAEQPNPDLWEQGPPITTRGEPLQLDGNEAEQFGLARHLVNNFEDVKTVYGLENSPELVEPGWVSNLVDVLASDSVAWALLFIGGMALYVEVQLPGIGIGGFVAALCFILFFWAKYLDGTAGALEIVLFMVGATCIILEIFVIPGFGIFGLGGGALLIASLILASQTVVLPTSSEELRELRDSMLVVGGPLIGMIVFGILLRGYFPKSRLFNHVMLAPPEDHERATIEQRESLGNYAHLLDKLGETTTRCAPSGKARIAGELVDVVSDGDLIPVGAKVQVVEVRGTRVVITAVS